MENGIGTNERKVEKEENEDHKKSAILRRKAVKIQRDCKRRGIISEDKSNEKGGKKGAWREETKEKVEGTEAKG